MGKVNPRTRGRISAFVSCTSNSKSFQARHRKFLICTLIALVAFLLFSIYLPTVSFINLESKCHEIDRTIPLSSLPKSNTQAVYKTRTYGRKCTSHEIDMIAQKSPHLDSSCPRITAVMKTLAENSPSSIPVVISVGCNKGDDFITSLRLFSKNYTYSLETWYDWMNSKNVSDYACGQHNDMSFDTIPNNTKSVIGYCIEPMESTINMLSSALHDVGYDTREARLIQAAVSNYPGTFPFPNVIMGRENVGFHSEKKYPNATTTTVQVITLETFVQQENVTMIDYLSIDSEGHDMQVILGGIDLFASQSVRFFEFEHHADGRWGTSGLRDLIELLDSMGYDCYWSLWHSLARITGCWSDKYLEKMWSNIVCINRGDEKTHAMMESMANRFIK